MQMYVFLSVTYCNKNPFINSLQKLCKVFFVYPLCSLFFVAICNNEVILAVKTGCPIFLCRLNSRQGKLEIL